MKGHDQLAFKSGEFDPSDQSRFDYLEGVISYLKEKKMRENISVYDMLMNIINVHHFAT